MFYVSAKFSHLKATKILVEEGAAIKDTNKYGFTPLMLGAYSSKLEFFHYLTEIGADININISNSITVLHLAISIRDAQNSIILYFGSS